MTSSLLDPIAAESPIASPVDQPASGGTVLTVGVGKEFATISEAIAAAHDNDVIAVDAGTYVDSSNWADRNIIYAKNVTIEGVGGMVHLEMGPQDLANGKGLLDVENGLTLKNFELSGANDGGTGGPNGSPWGNVAGIRVDGGNLTVINCYIHDNQDGILDTASGGTVIIDHSEFADNGAGDGYTHNIYINAADSFTVENSVFTGAYVGHEIKSRAAVTNIINNVIADGPTGTASYDIDIPDGGVATISGNVIEKGPDASNNGIIHYGGEGMHSYADNSLTVTNNTVINDDPYAGLIWNQAAAIGLNVTAQLSGNTLYNVNPANSTGAVSETNDTHLTVPASSEPGYSLALPYLGGTSITPYTQPLTLTLTTAGHTVSGGNTGAIITDTAGSNTIDSGAVGITLNEEGYYSTITTEAGSTNEITVVDRNTVTSAGNDTINVSGSYSSVTTNGTATINADGFSSYYLNGNDTLNDQGSGLVFIGANANATVNQAAAGGVPITKAAGGVVKIVLGSNAGGMTLSGAAMTAYAGGGGVSAAGSSTDTRTGTITFGAGNNAATTGAGADTFVFVQGQGGGTDQITGYRVGTDTLSFHGFTGNAVSSSVYSGGNTLVTLSDGTQITVVGVDLSSLAGSSSPPVTTPPVSIPPVTTPPVTTPPVTTPPVTQPPDPPTTGTQTLTAPNQTIRGGASALTIIDNTGGNAIIGGSGGINATLGAGSTVSTVAGASDTISVYASDTVNAAGNDAITVNGRYNSIKATGTSTVTLSGGPNTLTGGAGALTVTDAFGGNTIIGGSGGLSLTETGMYSAITTAAGATDTISTTDRSVITSNGTDTINVTGDYTDVTANGAATITASGFNTFTLNGADTLSDSGAAVVHVGAQANASVSVGASGSLNSAVNAGGRLSVTQALASGTATMTVAGGAATVNSSSNGIAGAGSSSNSAAETVTFGTGTSSFTDGAGAVTYVFVNGSGGGHDTINGYRSGVDTLSFQGFTSSAIANWQTVGNDTVGTLTDGTVITFTGVSVPNPNATTSAPPVSSPPTSPPTAPASTQSITLTSGNQTIQGGSAALTVTDTSGGGNTVNGGIGGLTMQLAYWDTVSTVAGATDILTTSSNDVINSAGTDTLNVVGLYNHLNVTGTSKVTLTAGGNTLTGGAGHLTIIDRVGSTITGGTGGIDVTETGYYGSINTIAESTNTISVVDRNSIISAGTDTITMSGDYTNVVASGAASITENSGYNIFSLSGNETLTANGTAVVSAGATANATLIVGGGGTVNVTRGSGATVSVDQSTATGMSTTTVSGNAGTIYASGGTIDIATASGGSSTITLGAASASVTTSGTDTITGGAGAATITTGNVGNQSLTFVGGSGITTLTAGAGALTATAGTGSLNVTFGSGTASVTAGAGDVFNFINGQGGGTDVISNYTSGSDQLVFSGFGANAITSQVVSNGNLNLVLADNTRITLMHATSI